MAADDPLMKRVVITIIYCFSVGLAVQGWLSHILPLSTKFGLTGASLVLMAIGFFLQA